VWLNTDLTAASALDWVVQGGTYGVYAALVADPPAATAGAATCKGQVNNTTLDALGQALTIGATSDIDGDGTGSLVGLFVPSIVAATGNVNVPAPALAQAMFANPPATKVDTTVCTKQPTTVGNGQVTNCSADNIF
jgi:hypothetical protein